MPIETPFRRTAWSIEGPSGPRAKLGARGTPRASGPPRDRRGGRRPARLAWPCVLRAARRGAIRGDVGDRVVRRLPRAPRGRGGRVPGAALGRRARLARRLLCGAL